MTTNLKIIEDALKDINVIPDSGSASAEQGQHGLRKLNQLMELWRESDMDVGWFAQTSTVDTIPIPDWMELPVTNALSVILAPKYGASISTELAAVGSGSIGAAERTSIYTKLRNRDTSYLPRGLGHRSRHNIETDS